MNCGFFSHSSLPMLTLVLVNLISAMAFLPRPNLPRTFPHPSIIYTEDPPFLPHPKLFHSDPAFPHPKLASLYTNLAYSCRRNLAVLPHLSLASPHPHQDLASPCPSLTFLPLPNLFHADSVYQLAFPRLKGNSRMAAISITHPLKVHIGHCASVSPQNIHPHQNLPLLLNPTAVL